MKERLEFRRGLQINYSDQNCELKYLRANSIVFNTLVFVSIYFFKNNLNTVILIIFLIFHSGFVYSDKSHSARKIRTIVCSGIYTGIICFRMMLFFCGHNYKNSYTPISSGIYFVFVLKMLKIK